MNVAKVFQSVTNEHQALTYEKKDKNKSDFKKCIQSESIFSTR